MSVTWRPARGGDVTRWPVAAVMLALVVPAPLVGASDPLHPPPRVQEEAHDSLDADSRLLAALEVKTAEVARLDARIGRLHILIDETVSRLREAETRHAYRLAAQHQAAHRWRRASAELAMAREALVEQAIAAHMWGRSPTALDLLRSSVAAQRIGAGSVVINSVLDAHQERIIRFRELDQRAGAMFRRARSLSESVLAEQHTVETELAGFRAQRDALEGLRARARVAAIAHEALLDRVRARRTRLAAEAESLATESSALSRELATVPTAARLRLHSLTLTRPLDGGRVSSRFGSRLHPILGVVRPHTGVDFAAPAGTAVRAAAAGTVVVAEARPGYGLTAVVQHDRGVATVYAHLSFIAVTEGGIVEPPAIVGFVGSTGTSTGPHLHFELRSDGVPVDPLPYLPVRQGQ